MTQFTEQQAKDKLEAYLGTQSLTVSKYTEISEPQMTGGKEYTYFDMTVSLSDGTTPTYRVFDNEKISPQKVTPYPS